MARTQIVTQSLADSSVTTEKLVNASVTSAKLASSISIGTLTITSGISGNVAFDTNTLFVDSTNDRVGIGTTTPSARLHTISTTEQLRLGYDASNYLSAAVSSAGLVTLTATGASAGVVFGNTTRPTAPNVTGTPLSSSLITLQDRDDRDWIYVPNQQRIKQLVLPVMLAHTFNGGSVTHMAGSSRVVLAANTTSFGLMYQTGNNNQTMCLAQAGTALTLGGLTVTDWSRPIILSFFGALNLTGASALIQLSESGQTSGPQMVSRGMGADFFWNGVGYDIRIAVNGSNRSTVTNATNTSPIVITTNFQTYSNGDLIRVYGVGGNTAANGFWTVANAAAHTFELSGSTGNGAYTSGGTHHRTSSVLATTIPHFTTFAMDLVAISGTAYLYLNGTLIGSLSGTPTSSQLAYAYLGAYQNGGSTLGYMIIDEVKLGIR